MRILFTSLILLFNSLSVLATEDVVQFQNDQQQELYLELIKELRCPKCQNQNIADSNAVVAKDMRVKTKQLVEQGQNKQQVVGYMVNRYGQFAHYRPPLNIATIMLWLLPISFVLLAVFFLVKRANPVNTGDIESTQTEESANTTHELDKELEQLLADAKKEEKK